MNTNQGIDNMVRLCNNVGRATLLTGIFGLAVVLVTGCASTSGGVKTALVSPVTSTRQSSPPGDDSFYQPLRSPGFNDLTGS